MALEPIEIALLPNEILELLKRTINDRQKRITEVERRIRELKRTDAEIAYLSALVGPEFANPDNKNNAQEEAQLETERQQLNYVIEAAQYKLAEIQGQPLPKAAPHGTPGAARRPAPSPQPRSGGGNNMWGA